MKSLAALLLVVAGASAGVGVVVWILFWSPLWAR